MNTRFPLTWIVLLGLMAAITIVAAADLQKIDDSNFIFGSAHEHASLSIMIHGKLFDLTQEKYQLTSPYIHLENNNGYVVHRHSQGVSLGYLFETLDIGLSENCLVFSDRMKYCTNDKYSLKFLINQRHVEDIKDYLIFEGDIILISYGNETQEEINQQFKDQIQRGFPFEIRERNSNNLANA